jgi:histidinol-phosphate aminotransferase
MLGYYGFDQRKMYMDRQYLVPDYLREMSTYKAGKPIEELSREKGLKRISKLSSNENPLGPSPKAVKAVTEKIWEIHRYPDMSAYDLKRKLCGLYRLLPENIILGSGSEGIMGYIVRAFLGPGQEALTSEHTFIGFYILAQSVGATVIKAPMTKDYRFDVKALIQKITSKTKIIYIANPNNPTGTYITKIEFDELMKHVPEHTLVILDEAYFEYAVAMASDYPDSMDYRYDNVITLRTFSKAYGLAGLRCGYGFAHAELINHLSKVKLPFEPGLLSQVAATQALEDQRYLAHTLEDCIAVHKQFLDFLKEEKLTWIPSVTNFVAVDLKTPEAAFWLYDSLLNVGVIVRPLDMAQMPTFLRISMGSLAEMNHLMTAWRELMPTLKKKMQV